MGSDTNCRPPIGSFSGSNTGNVFFARGDQPVKRWDGFLGDYVNAGVPAPSTGLTLSESVVFDDDNVEIDTGLAGIYYAYLRFLDSRGNVSNLSPASNSMILLGSLHGVVSDLYTVAGTLKPHKVLQTRRNTWTWQRNGWVEVVSYNHGLVDGELIKFKGIFKPGRPSSLAYSLYDDVEYKAGVIDKDRFMPIHPDDVRQQRVVNRKLVPGLEWGPWLIPGQGGGAYQGGATWKQTGPGIQYEGVTVPTDDRVMTRQILRNKNGNVGTFYVDIEHTRGEWEQHVRESLYGNADGEFGTVYTSSTADQDLGEEIPLRTLDGMDLNIARHSEPPSFKRVILSHYNRLFAAVNLNYKVGSAKVVTGLTTVVGNSTCWTSSMVGRVFAPRAGNPTKQYEITAVDETAQEITLSDRWEEITNFSQLYAISPGPTEELSIHFSETLLPESWDRNKVFQLTDDPLAGDMTSLFALGPRLFIAFEHRIFNLNYMSDPALDGHVSFSAARGCVNNRTVIQNGTEAYLMDQRGIYVFDGSKVQEISMAIQSVFAGDYKYAIDWSMSEHFHASHNHKDKTLRWFVSMGGFTYPRHALAFNYRMNRWWIEEYPEPVSASSLGRVDSKNQNVWSGSYGRVFVSTQNPSDGLPTHVEPFRSVVSSATSTRLMDYSSELFSQWVGAPLHICEGKGEGQTRLIVQVGSGYLQVDRPFMIIPDSTSKYQVGGFRWQYSTPLMMLESPPGSKAIRSIETRFQPTAKASTLAIKKYTDFSTTPDLFEYTRPSEDGDGASTESGSGNTLIDMTFGTGSVQQAFDSTDTPRSKRGRAVRFAVEGVPNGESQKIYSLIIEGVQGQ